MRHHLTLNMDIGLYVVFKISYSHGHHDDDRWILIQAVTKVVIACDDYMTLGFLNVVMSDSVE